MSATIDAATRDDVRAAIDGADIVPLLLVLVQLTGEMHWLDRAAPHIHGAWDHLQDVPPTLQREIRDALADVLADRDRREGDRLPDDETLRRMMSAAVGEDVSDEYVSMLRSECGLGRAEDRIDALTPIASDRRRDFTVVVIGAGISGLAAAVALRQLDLPYVVLEKNDEVGGTWWENSYPGAGVDTPNHFYSFSFAQNPDWTRYFVKRDELLGYFVDFATDNGVRDHIRFGCEVTAATWDESRRAWIVRYRTTEGTEHEIKANALISAVGQLNRPALPAIDGIDCFRGPIVHTAAWDHDVSTAGRRVALIGTGASGMQVGPSIAPDVEHLTVFQRSPHWVSANPKYHQEVEDAKRWALRNVPHYASWYRFLLFWASADGIYPSLRVDPAWPHPERSLNATNDAMRGTLVAHIEKELAGRPDLVAKCVPDYPPYGKRMLRDNHWYSMLRRDNVSLVTEPIERIEADAVITTDGQRHPVDIIVCATGFAATKMLAPMDIRGRRGRTIRDIWGDEDPRAHLGITVPEFPNFFVLFGPNTVLAHGGSAVFHSECQVRYTAEALRLLLDGGHAAMDCRQEAHDAYNRRVDETIGQLVWAHPGVTNWYKNSKGRVVMTSPWRLVDYWHLTRHVDPDDYEWID